MEKIKDWLKEEVRFSIVFFSVGFVAAFAPASWMEILLTNNNALDSILLVTCIGAGAATVGLVLFSIWAYNKGVHWEGYYLMGCGGGMLGTAFAIFYVWALNFMFTLLI